MELHLSNALYTSIVPAGKTSRLNRAFINENWASKGDWKLRAFPRKNSDYRGILVFLSEVNWGPNPF